MYWISQRNGGKKSLEGKPTPHAPWRFLNPSPQATSGPPSPLSLHLYLLISLSHKSVPSILSGTLPFLGFICSFVMSFSPLQFNSMQFKWNGFEKKLKLALITMHFAISKQCPSLRHESQLVLCKCICCSCKIPSSCLLHVCSASVEPGWLMHYWPAIEMWWVQTPCPPHEFGAAADVQTDQCTGDFATSQCVVCEVVWAYVCDLFIVWLLQLQKHFR